MMAQILELDQLEGGLLNHGVIQIFGKIDDITHDYVQAAITTAESNGIVTPQGLALPDLTFKINSIGGSLHYSFMIYDMIRLYGGNTLGVVIGSAMSGANLILQACNHRAASRGSLLHVHNLMATLSLDIMRDKSEMRITMEQLEEWQKETYAIYRRRTKKSIKELREIFKNDEAFSAKKALKLGFIDEII